MKTVGAYEAKTHLPALLEEVAQGATIMITKHGKPVAMLTPVGAEPRMSKEEALAGLRRLREKQSLRVDSAKELIEEGRQHKSENL